MQSVAGCCWPLGVSRINGTAGVRDINGTWQKDRFVCYVWGLRQPSMAPRVTYMCKGSWQQGTASSVHLYAYNISLLTWWHRDAYSSLRLTEANGDHQTHTSIMYYILVSGWVRVFYSFFWGGFLGGFELSRYLTFYYQPCDGCFVFRAGGDTDCAR